MCSCLVFLGCSLLEHDHHIRREPKQPLESPYGQALRPADLAEAEHPKNSPHQLASHMVEPSLQRILQPPIELPQLKPHGAEMGWSFQVLSTLQIHEQNR